MKHTEVPWKVVSLYNFKDAEDGWDIISKKHNHTVFTDNKANAHFIVKACNNHYELLEALKKAIDWIKRGPDLDSPKAKPYMNKLEQAIAKAEV